METKTQKIGKFTIIAGEREYLNSYPNFKYFVRVIQATPKAKYLNEKTLNHYVYMTEEEANNSAQKFFNSIESQLNRREEERIKRVEAQKTVKASDFYKVNDIICNSWGYEQTNIEFYQVIEVGNKTIKIKEICQEEEENSHYSHGMACNVLPVLNKFYERGEEYTLRVKPEGILSNPESFYYMHKWGGNAKYKSWYA